MPPAGAGYSREGVLHMGFSFQDKFPENYFQALLVFYLLKKITFFFFPLMRCTLGSHLYLPLQKTGLNQT